MAKAKEVYGKFDNNSDGGVDRVELREALWNLHNGNMGDEASTQTQIAFMNFVDQEFNKADKDFNSKLDFKEFCTLYVTVAASMKT